MDIPEIHKNDTQENISAQHGMLNKNTSNNKLTITSKKNKTNKIYRTYGGNKQSKNSPDVVINKQDHPTEYLIIAEIIQQTRITYTHGKGIVTYRKLNRKR